MAGILLKSTKQKESKMKPADFVYQSVLNGCRMQGLDEIASTEQANEALDKYKRNQFDGKPLDLINQQITKAKKFNKKVKKK